MIHGKGVYRWPDGRTYEGEYYCNKKHGWGVYTWQDGSRYEGPWMNGKRHGAGRHYLKSNRYREGVWHLDKRVKWTSGNIDELMNKPPIENAK
jgi:hypothetical protein